MPKLRLLKMSLVPALFLVFMNLSCANEQDNQSMVAETKLTSNAINALAAALPPSEAKKLEEILHNSSETSAAEKLAAEIANPENSDELPQRGKIF